MQCTAHRMYFCWYFGSGASVAGVAAATTSAGGDDASDAMALII